MFVVLVIAAEWRIFSKAGQPGWAAIIPIYNTIVLLRVAGRSGWWFLLFLIPIVNFIVTIIVMNDLSKAFGKGIGTTLGLIFLSPIFIMIPRLRRRAVRTRRAGARLRPLAHVPVTKSSGARG